MAEEDLPFSFLLAYVLCFFFTAPDDSGKGEAKCEGEGEEGGSQGKKVQYYELHFASQKKGERGAVVPNFIYGRRVSFFSSLHLLIEQGQKYGVEKCKVLIAEGSECLIIGSPNYV